MFYQTPNLTVFEKNVIFEICFALTNLAQILAHFDSIWFKNHKKVTQNR